MDDCLLDIRNLSVHFETTEGIVHAVDEVSFSISKGEIVGLVGESGSGKTVTSLSILRLVASPPGRYRSGEILFEGRDCLKVDQEEIRKIRGGEIAFIFQDPTSALNPVKRVVNQIAEVIELHQGVDHTQSVKKAIEMMDMVGIPSAAVRAHDYPHQLSGGMRQRIMIAMAFSCHPKLLIADEPTTALDVTIQAQILEMMRQLWRKFQVSILFITHDLGIIAQMCTRVVVMYAGKVTEIGPVSELFSSPQHPYTQGLLKARPTLGNKKNHLYVIGGSVPRLIKPIQGCRFHPRCQQAVAICKEAVPPLTELSKVRQVACHLVKKQL